MAAISQAMYAKCAQHGRCVQFPVSDGADDESRQCSTQVDLALVSQVEGLFDRCGGDALASIQATASSASRSSNRSGAGS
jgi:hypothetical protein